MTRLGMSNSQRRNLRSIVTAGFNPTSFQYALNAYLGENVWDHASGNAPFPHQVLQVINAAEQEWWTDDLLHALRSASPRNLDLYRFAESVGLGVRVEGTLEELVTTAGFLDLPTLIEGLTVAQASFLLRPSSE